MNKEKIKYIVSGTVAVIVGVGAYIALRQPALLIPVCAATGIIAGFATFKNFSSVADKLEQINKK